MNTLEVVRPKYPIALALPIVSQGKTRDTYPARRIESERRARFIHARNRISTHNIVHVSEIPYKGEVLTALTVFWFTTVLKDFPNHLVAYGPRIYDFLPGSRVDYPEDLHHSGIVVRELDIVPVEFIFRARLSGSLYRDYYSKGRIDPYGLHLPPGMKLMTPFDEPVFTPTEKSDADEPLRAGDVYAQHPEATDLQRRAYKAVRSYLRTRGIECIDWKGEVGIDRGSGHPMLADEVGTPDCCRFCRAECVRLGEEPPWLDKQIARDEAERVWGGGTKHPLTFTPDVVHRVSATYVDVFEMITGMSLKQFQKERLS